MTLNNHYVRKKVMNIYRNLLLILIIFLYTLIYPSFSYGNEKFNQWLNDFKLRAVHEGISNETVNIALKDVRYLERIIVLDRKQPEFFEKTYEYVNNRVTQNKIALANEALNKNLDIFNRASERFGIDKEILISLWGMETNFGVNKGKVDIISALATLSFDDRRPQYFEKELIILLKLIDNKTLSYQSLQGSWAGAIGNFQFMPSTILKYAIKNKSSNQIDLINSLEDSVMSAANYLHSVGWKKNKNWGYEVQSTKSFDQNLINTDARNFQNKISTIQLKKLGFKNKDGTEINITDDKGWLIRPDGNDGPVYFVLDNFIILMDWNRSLRYGISVGTLADKIKI